MKRIAKPMQFPLKLSLICIKYKTLFIFINYLTTFIVIIIVIIIVIVTPLFYTASVDNWKQNFQVY